jgi:hypothetical protein
MWLAASVFDLILARPLNLWHTIPVAISKVVTWRRQLSFEITNGTTLFSYDIHIISCVIRETAK